MPIKEIVAFGMTLWAGLMLTQGPQGVKAVQFKILREVTRTDNWGSPSIFSVRSRAPK